MKRARDFEVCSGDELCECWLCCTTTDEVSDVEEVTSGWTTEGKARWIRERMKLNRAHNSDAIQCLSLAVRYLMDAHTVKDEAKPLYWKTCVSSFFPGDSWDWLFEQLDGSYFTYCLFSEEQIIMNEVGRHDANRFYFKSLGYGYSRATSHTPDFFLALDFSEADSGNPMVIELID